MVSDETMYLRYRPDLAHLADYLIGSERQIYENYRMIFSREWDRYLNSLRSNLSLASSIAAALIYSITLPWYPGVWSVMGYWVFAPAPVVAIAVWCILWRGSIRSQKAYSEAFGRWNLQNELLYSPYYDVEIGPEGFKQVSRTDTVALSWTRYHLAVTQPDNLVLVFHGTIAVIPNDVLPMTPEKVLERIHAWILAQQKVITPLSSEVMDSAG
ncbi:hypothetical protein [uncultured Agrobacterium sp.]|uniref:hypothetical protein n=1 Tax=uncultured Agrobacterium sp. TaxID=157277 RepID=UPI00258EA939|nr:hypothetical protein [uncultured Agrobacterium sp.]